MARPREFDEETVLQRARDAFWKHGYAATSLSDLLAATGLTKGSLYKAFDDKHSLFMRALNVYLNEGYEHMRNLLFGAETMREGFRSWLEEVAAMATRGKTRCGCMAVNTAVELGPHDNEVRKALRRQEDRVRAAYREALERGIAQGEFAAALPVDDVVATLSVVVSGIQVAGKATMERTEAQAVVSLAMNLLQ